MKALFFFSFSVFFFSFFVFVFSLLLVVFLEILASIYVFAFEAGRGVFPKCSAVSSLVCLFVCFFIFAFFLGGMQKRCFLTTRRIL